MTKKLLFLLPLVAALVSCGGRTKQTLRQRIEAKGWPAQTIRQQDSCFFLSIDDSITVSVWNVCEGDTIPDYQTEKSKL